MTKLICTGTFFSNWQEIAKPNASNSPKYIQVCEELSALSEKICQQQFPESDEFSRISFTPSDEHIDPAKQVLLSAADEDFFLWTDINCTLCLDFWQSAINSSRFLLFYSSPEFELSSYISKHNFDAANIESVMKAWFVRTQAMLAFFMNNRDQCLLINVQSASSEPRLFAQLVKDRLNLTIAHMSSTEKEKHENSVLVEYLATSLLLDNAMVSELFDEVRSAATPICEQDKAITEIHSRSRSMINAFLNEAASLRRLTKSNKELQDDLTLMKLQINQVKEELEYYFQLSREQGDIFANYLSSDPFLSIAHQARQSQ